MNKISIPKFKYLVVIVFTLHLSNSLLGQNQPHWMIPIAREMHFPNDKFITGSASESMSAGASLAEITIQVKNDAKTELVQNIRARVKSESMQRSTQIKQGEEYQHQSSFENTSTISSDAEIAGIQTESYYNINEKIVYGFAYVEREKLSAYYQNKAANALQKAETSLETASRESQSGLKSKVRSECMQATGLIAEAEEALDLLVAVEPNASGATELLSKMNELRLLLNKLQALASQQVVVCLKSTEDNLGKAVSLLANKVKAFLSHENCTFTTDEEEAELIIDLTATVRKHDYDNADLKFSYADVAVDLFDTNKQRSIFADEFSVKGGALTYESAGLKALENASTILTEKLAPWIANY